MHQSINEFRYQCYRVPLLYCVSGKDGKVRRKEHILVTAATLTKANDPVCWKAGSERTAYLRQVSLPRPYLEITWLLFHCTLVYWSQQQQQNNNDKMISKLNDFKMERRPVIS